MSSIDFQQAAQDYERIEKAISFLEQNFLDQPDLAEVAEHLHLSPYHFQRLFKRWAGLSPKQFVQFLTIAYAKERLAEASSVLEASLAAGLSGPGRLHDLFVTFEAMTPGQYKTQGDGLQIGYGFHATPFGPCLLATTDRGVCSLWFLGQAERAQTQAQALEALQAAWPQSSLRLEPDRTQPLIDQIFGPVRRNNDRPLPLLLKGTNFQIKVWEALLKIPEGAMVSYQDVARAIGQPKAARAVGSAVGRNPLGYLIPCHRVIKKKGLISQYRWGEPRKKAMLGWEAGRRAA